MNPAPAPLPPCISPPSGAAGGPSSVSVALAGTDAVTHPAQRPDPRRGVTRAGDGIGFLIALVLSILAGAGMWFALAWVLS